MTNTTNYNLTKQAGNENINIDLISQNMDIIDEELKKRETGQAQAEGRLDALEADASQTGEIIAGHDTVITQLQSDMSAAGEQLTALDSAKADKVAGAIAGHIATLDASGNLVDDGKSFDEIVFKMEESNVTDVYVSKTGNDDTGDGSASKPFFTIKKALSVIRLMPPRPGRIDLEIGAGDYSNEDTIYNIYHSSSMLNVNGFSSDNKSILASEFQCHFGPVRFSNLHFNNSGSGIKCYSDFGSVTVSGCIFENLKHGVNVATSFSYVSDCTFNNCGGCITSAHGACVFSGWNNGSNNSVALYADSGIIIGVNVGVPDAATSQKKDYGGQIFLG